MLTGRRRPPRALTAALLAVLTAVLAAPAQPAAKPYRVGIDEGPGLNASSGLTRLGPMRVFYGRGPVEADRWTLAYAIEAFGAPGFQHGSPGECMVEWPRLGLTVGFRGHQADSEDGCRTPVDLYVADARIAGSAARGRWVTAKGTRIGTTVKRLRRQYRDAERIPGGWRLVRSSVCFGTSCEEATSLVAVTRRGRVSELRAVNHAD